MCKLHFNSYYYIVVVMVVKIINLRYNKDNEILLGYSMLITKIKDNIAAGMEPKRAIDSTIRECIEEDYLTDFLKKHGEEVGNMKFYEFTQEEYEALIAEESFEDGRTEGLSEGIRAFILDHLEDGTPCEVICRKLVKRFSLTEKDAAKYIAQASVSERK